MKTGLIILWGMCALSATAQTVIKRDATIKQMVDEVSATNIEATVRKLVSFRTRHSLSDTLSKTEGIGAARNWIKSEMEKYAAASNGRMKVEFDTFTQPAGGRFDKPTVLKNADGKDVLVNQVGCYGINLGRIDFYFDNDASKIASGKSIVV